MLLLNQGFENLLLVQVLRVCQHLRHGLNEMLLLSLVGCLLLLLPKELKNKVEDVLLEFEFDRLNVKLYRHLFEFNVVLQADLELAKVVVFVRIR